MHILAYDSLKEAWACQADIPCVIGGICERGAGGAVLGWDASHLSVGDVVKAERLGKAKGRLFFPQIRLRGMRVLAIVNWR